MYSLLDPESWRALPAYLDAARSLGVASATIVVATKGDCELRQRDQRIRDEARAWAEQQALPHLSASPRSSSELLAVFKRLALQVALQNT